MSNSDAVLKKIEIALNANGGREFREECCQCSGGGIEEPPYRCMYCAIRDGLIDAETEITRLKDTISLSEECYRLGRIGLERKAEELSTELYAIKTGLCKLTQPLSQ